MLLKFYKSNVRLLLFEGILETTGDIIADNLLFVNERLVVLHYLKSFYLCILTYFCTNSSPLKTSLKFYFAQSSFIGVFLRVVQVIFKT